MSRLVVAVLSLSLACTRTDLRASNKEMGDDCLENAECPEVCIGGTCTEYATGGESCDEPADCAAGLLCPEGFCLEPECVDHDCDDDGSLGVAFGGPDCDDQNPSSHPGALEGPNNTATCSDGADNDCDGDTDANDDGCNITMGEVTALFPSLAGFTDYGARTDPSMPVWREPEAPCPTGSVTSTADCFHAGVLRQATITGWNDCAELSATDSAGALQWRCVNGQPLRVVSTGFVPGKGAADLLTTSGFASLSITLSHAATVVATSPATVWWPNDVVTLPPADTDVVVLSSADTIYVVAGTVHGHGYNLDADGIAVIGLAGSLLELDAAALNTCDITTGEVTFVGANDRRECLLAAGAQSRLWVEVDGDLSPGTTATGRGIPAMFYGVTMSRIHHSHFQGGWTGPRMNNSRGITVSESRSDDFQRMGFLAADGSTGLLFWGIVASNCGGDHAGTAGVGITSSSTDVRVADALVANTYPYGVFVYDTSSATVTHVTAASQTYAGIASSASVLHASNSAILGTETLGFLVRQAVQPSRLQQVLAVGSETGLRLRDNTVGSELIDIRLSNHTFPCYVSNAPDEVLEAGVQGPCTAKTPPSPVADLPSVAVADLVGGLTGSVLACADIASWYLGAFAAWIPDPSLGTSWGRCWLDLVNPCQCQPYDWYPRNDPVAGAPALIVGQAGRFAGATFTPGAPCPDTVGADGVAESTDGVPYLVNALEIIGDGLGNDNRFCESHEACWFTEDLGALLHQPDPARPTSGACVFTPAGGVTGVELYRR